MLKRNFLRTTETSNKPDSFYWSKFRDPVAKLTEWKPLKRGGRPIHSRKLVQLNPSRLEFRRTFPTVPAFSELTLGFLSAFGAFPGITG